MTYRDPKPVFRRISTPGPFASEERPLRYRFIAAPIIGTLAYLLLVMS
jgi:hypothetical protein